ncbi:MAG: hypothetical protein AAGA30_21005, partial [Planctomycetota bacterium]
ALISIQLMSDLYNGTTLTDIFKGHSNLGLAATSFLFFAILFKDNCNALVIFLISRGIGGLLFSNLLQTSDEILSNEYWDLRVGFWAAPIVVAASLLTVRSARPLVIIGLLTYGGAAVTFGGRSHGLVYLAAAMALTLAAPNVKQRFSNISRKYVRRGLVAAVGFAVLFFPIYVYLGLQGVITKKAQTQLQELSNPYNPIEVLLAGRKGIQYGINAAYRKPIAGYGSRSYTGDYLPADVQRWYPGQQDRNNIHSMLFECFAFGGLGAGICYLLIMFYSLKRCLRMLASPDYRCILLASVVAVDFAWVSIGSPLASFRLTWPIMYAMTFAIPSEGNVREKIGDFLVPRRHPSLQSNPALYHQRR